MKKAVVFVIFALLMQLIVPCALAEEATEQELDAMIRDEVASSIGELELYGWQEAIKEATGGNALLFGETVESSIERFALQGFDMDAGRILDYFVDLFREMYRQNISLIIKLLGAALLTGLVKMIFTGSGGGLDEIAGFVCYCFAVGIAITQFMWCVKLGGETIDILNGFIQCASPVLITMLTATGATASSGVMQPAMSLLCSGLTSAIKNIVMPIVLAGGVLSMLNNLTGRAQLSQLNALCKSSAKWILGLMSTIYFGVVALQGMSAKTADGLSIRTAKYALDKFVPVVGGMVSGTVDTVLSCAVLVKNAAGITAILIAFVIVIVPLSKILATVFAFRLASAACEPVADERVPKMLNGVADVMNYVFGAVVVLFIMFMITVGMLIGMNGSVGA